MYTYSFAHPAATTLDVLNLYIIKDSPNVLCHIWKNLANVEFEAEISGRQYLDVWDFLLFSCINMV